VPVAAAPVSALVAAAEPVTVRAPVMLACSARPNEPGLTCSSIRFSACSRLGSPEVLTWVCSVRSALSRPRSF